ncbi:serine/threonine-protein kinase [Gemmatimonas sp.]|uniref:serine/threonine-protein kinase n=1 Tax=Gemmatimonas sp. TaxID=1962908 RepID=UPI0027B9BAB1|nr:serine/threonine-protein kinase [Gemmatimonas sp.]
MTITEPTTPDGLSAFRSALSGQYAIQRELGRGGMGIVLLARDEKLDRSVALKVLPPHLADNAEIRERFLREARMAAQLSHPNIVPVYRADELGGYAFFAMGFVDGETLGDRIRDRSTLPATEVVRVLREVAWALAYAHARSIVHRDIKPDNILLERATGRAIVSDFGIARAEFNPALTQDGLVLGTVHFMSPEQATGDALDGRSDLYALGCIGFLALTGRLPFEGTTPQGILVAHATKEPPLVRSVAPNVDANVASVIDRLLRKNRDERFTTGEELATALDKALEKMQQAQRDQGTPVVLDSEHAMAVWRRAAELQAEAATRLEQRVRSNDTRALVPGDGAATSGGAAPTDAYRLRDVEAAAVEAGISQRYVALALDEIRARGQGVVQPAEVSAFRERLATRLLGTNQRTLSVSRVFRSPARTVLPALGRSLQAAPWMLSLKDTLGGHPLDGGVLVFTLPAMVDGNYRWTWTRYGVYVPEVRVSIAAVPGDPNACEVTMTVDLRAGLGYNLFGYGAIAGGGGVIGGIIVGAIAKKAMLLAGAAIAGPAVTGALVIAAGLVAFTGPMYRWEMRKAAAELTDALAAIDASMRAFDIFGAPPPPLPPPKPGGGDLTGMI